MAMAHSHVLLGAGDTPARPAIRSIGLADIKTALARGVDDFYAMPTHAIFLCIVYPIIGLVLARLAFGYSTLPLLYPLISGFALVGPFASLGLYEMSRRRELGEDVSISHAFEVLQSSSIGAITALSLLLFVIFLIWLGVANAIYIADFGYAPPSSIEHFVRNVLTTPAGWNLIIVGNGVGLLFAIVVLAIGAFSFPLLVDRDVGAAVALSTSVRAVMKNPGTMAVWGVIVAVLLLIGSVPFFLGLTVVMPILGHATWHLYRLTIDAESGQRPEALPRTSRRRYAADFPSSLFPWGK
jgi:uncharacterized membrane protein